MKAGSISAILIAGLWPVAIAQTGNTPGSVPAAAAPVSSLVPAQPTAPPARQQDRRAGRRTPNAAGLADPQQPTAHGRQQRRIEAQARDANQNNPNRPGRD